MAGDPGRKPAGRMGRPIIVGVVIAALLVFFYMRFVTGERTDLPVSQMEPRTG